jgi:hypothetical protein
VGEDGELVFGEFGPGEFEFLHFVEDGGADDEAHVFFVVGGDDVPWALLGGGGADGILVGVHVIAPMGALFDVALFEFPVFAGGVDPGEEASFLFLVGDVEEEFGDVDAIAMGVGLVVGDILETVREEALEVGGGFVGEALDFGDDFGVDFADEDFLVVAAVEDAEAAAGGAGDDVAPEEVVVEFGGGGAFEGVGFDALGVHAGHDVFDGGVLAGGVHGLEDEEHAMAVLGIHFLLELVDLDAELGDQFLVVGVIAVEALDFGFGFFDAKVFAAGNAEVVEVEVEFHGGTGLRGLGKN